MAKRKRRSAAVLDRVPPSEPPVRPGLVSPMRAVPREIARPPYAASGEPGPSTSSATRTADEIERMRRSGAIAAEVLLFAVDHVEPGITTDKLDAFVHDEIVRRGAYPSPLNYRGYPKSVCTSVNEVVCHGIPDSRVLQDGDIMNIDVTIYAEGVHGDTSVTVLIGDVDEQSRHLVRETRAALYLAIDEVAPDRPFNVIGKAIEGHARRSGLSVVREFIGHGVGTEFHTALQIPHYFDRHLTRPIESDMTFTIEPMLNLGGPDLYLWDDEWTAVTRDGRRSAQFEHTLLVTDDGAEILTRTSSGTCAADAVV